MKWSGCRIRWKSETVAGNNTKMVLFHSCSLRSLGGDGEAYGMLWYHQWFVKMKMFRSVIDQFEKVFLTCFNSYCNNIFKKARSLGPPKSSGHNLYMKDMDSLKKN